MKNTIPATAQIEPQDLSFFSALVAAGSLSAAARQWGLSTAAISKRLSLMETRLGLALLTRSTRRMSLTAEGETYLAHARRILSNISDLEQLMGLAQSRPSGLLRVNATLGFGRSHVAALISRFAKQFEEIQVRLHLSADPPLPSEDAYDVCIRFGPPPDARLIARRIAANRRLLCASKGYLLQHGVPKAPSELTAHDFISIQQGEENYSVLRLSKGREAKVEVVKTRGRLTTNDGGIAVQWALDGHGILLRAEWDIRKYLESGRLVQLLPNYRTPDADIYAVYAPAHQNSARVRAFVDFLSSELRP